MKALLKALASFMVRERLAAFLAAAILMASSAAHADAGQVTLGVLASWRPWHATRVGLTGELGVSDSLAAHVELETGLTGEPPALGALGLTLMWDVWTWVPVLSVAGGCGYAPGEPLGKSPPGKSMLWQPRVLVGMEARRFFSATYGVSVGLGGEWRLSQWRVLARVGWFYQFF